MSNMKLIMENWDTFLNEDVAQPTTWGELAQNIMLAQAASKWPRVGKALAKFGADLNTGLKNGMTPVYIASDG